jgi:hypothetical protein
MTDYLACHFERIARNLSSLYSAIHSIQTAPPPLDPLCSIVKVHTFKISPSANLTNSETESTSEFDLSKTL